MTADQVPRRAGHDEGSVLVPLWRQRLQRDVLIPESMDHSAACLQLLRTVAVTGRGRGSAARRSKGIDRIGALASRACQALLTLLLQTASVDRFLVRERCFVIRLLCLTIEQQTVRGVRRVVTQAGSLCAGIAPGVRMPRQPDGAPGREGLADGLIGRRGDGQEDRSLVGRVGAGAFEILGEITVAIGFEGRVDEDDEIADAVANRLHAGAFAGWIADGVLARVLGDLETLDRRVDEGTAEAMSDGDHVHVLLAV